MAAVVCSIVRMCGQIDMEELIARLEQVLSERTLKERFVIPVSEYELLSEIDKQKAWEEVRDGDHTVGYREPLPDWEARKAYWEWEKSMWSTWLGKDEILNGD